MLSRSPDFSDLRVLIWQFRITDLKSVISTPLGCQTDLDPPSEVLEPLPKMKRSPTMGSLKPFFKTVLVEKRFKGDLFFLLCVLSVCLNTFGNYFKATLKYFGISMFT